MINTWPGWKNVKLLGKGSFGSVYEIEKEEFGKVYKAALKVISIPADETEYRAVKSMGADEESVKEYFYASVEAVAKEFALLNELKGFTNIVSYEDHMVIKKEDTFGWDILIRMELLTPLEKYRVEHPMDEKEICQLGIDICKALEICRQKNILHRDVKPANIFVNELGNYKLGDFGIARTINRTLGTLSHKGTYNYMAPEIYQGKNYGYTADIYSLGIVLYRLLNNNKLPFFTDKFTPGMVEEATAKRMSGEKIPLLQINKELASIIQKCIEYKPENRYQSAEELRKELEEYLRKKEAPTFVYIEKKVVEKTSKAYEEEQTRIIEEPKLENKIQSSLRNQKEVKKKQNSLGNIKPEENKEEIKKLEPKPKLKLPLFFALFAMIITAILGYNIFNREQTVKFGSYNGQEIEWIVLDEKEDGSKLLLSKYILLEKEYNYLLTDVTWETCTLRRWLNNHFYEEAFSTSEQSKIQTTKVVNKDNEEYGTEGGSDTEDKVFLLSIEEVNKYFDSDYERRARRLDDNNTWSYWLRSPGYRSHNAARVDYGGGVYEYGSDVVSDDYGVRPALWVNL